MSQTASDSKSKIPTLFKSKQVLGATARVKAATSQTVEKDAVRQTLNNNQTRTITQKNSNDFKLQYSSNRSSETLRVESKLYKYICLLLWIISANVHIKYLF